MQYEQRHCTRCKEFKSLTEFYKQGVRYESLCKVCKRSSRAERRQIQVENQSGVSVSEAALAINGEQTDTKAVRTTYQDFGFTESEFIEIVEIFEDLIRFNAKGK